MMSYLKNRIKKKKRVLSFDSSLELRDITFKYSKDCILKNLNFKIHNGESVGVIGESGSEKVHL